MTDTVEGTATPVVATKVAAKRTRKPKPVEAAPPTPAGTAALTRLCDVIDGIGGVVQVRKDVFEPVGERVWTDLGAAYIAACEALNRTPVIVRE